MLFRPSVPRLLLKEIPQGGVEVIGSGVVRLRVDVQFGDQVLEGGVFFFELLHNGALLLHDGEGFFGVGLAVRLQVAELTVVLLEFFARVVGLVLIICKD